MVSVTIPYPVSSLSLTMDISGVSWVSGSLIEPGRKQSPNDHAVIVGDGEVFETLQVHEGDLLLLHDIWGERERERENSSEGLGTITPQMKIKSIDAVLHADPEAGLITRHLVERFECSGSTMK